MLCRNHPAAIVNCPLRERIARFELVLGFHIDDEPNQLFRLCVRLRRNSVEADIVVDGAFRQRCILTVAAADGAVCRGMMRTVCIICMNTDCADFRLSFDVLFRNLIDWARAVLLYAAFMICASTSLFANNFLVALSYRDSFSVCPMVWAR